MSKYEYLPQNTDRLGNSSSEARLYAPIISETHGFKMMLGTNLTTERRNPSYKAWIKSRIKNVMASPNRFTVVKDDDEIQEQDDKSSSDKEETTVKRKDSEFVNNYLMAHDPQLKTESGI